MTAVLRRYWLLIVGALLLLFLILFLFLSRNNVEKIPSRGVFVSSEMIITA